MDADDILLDFPTGTVVTPELVAPRAAALSGATVLPYAGGQIGPAEPMLVYVEERELDRLRADADRLDWLEQFGRERQASVTSHFPQGLRTEHQWDVFGQGVGPTFGDTLRDAIDEARGASRSAGAGTTGEG
jgi:hypothetical protein